MQRIYIDMSTARGIQHRLEQRVVEIKAVPQQGHSNDRLIEEFVALIHEIDMGIDNMIEDMHRQDRERALEQQIHLDEAGVTHNEFKMENF